MTYFKISLYSDELLTMKQKKEYINKLYSKEPTYNINKKRQKGIIEKFNNSIGFKEVVLQWDNFDCAIPLQIKNPKNYFSPQDIIFKGLKTPILSFNILEFYIPKEKIEHTEPRFCYKTRDIAIKWKHFLNKVFPKLKTSFE